MLNVLCVCGARPNFMKIAPLMAEMRRRKDLNATLIHTGQHYDEKMSKAFFGDLGIPRPDANLEVGSGSHAAQTAEIMKRFEPVCLDRKPDWVIVVGDVNSTIACALVAAKLDIKVAHVEAGLRSFDRTMPEEINRLLTDAISDLLFVSEPSGVENLRKEGIAEAKIHLVGNVMIDTLLQNRSRADASRILEVLGLTSGKFAALTLHRPSNVDTREAFEPILSALERIARDMPIVFPIHPRSRKNISGMGLDPRLAQTPAIKLIEPLGYLDFLKLMADSALVLTDSGGIQEETTILGVPCLTLRENTERPITITQGTNRLAGTRTDTILQAYEEVCRCHSELGAQAAGDKPLPVRTRSASDGRCTSGKRPDLWDGKAAQRIVDILKGVGRARLLPSR